MSDVLEHSGVEGSASSALKEYLRGVVGVVEANAFERKGLRDHYLQAKCGEWERNLCGMTATVGHLGGMPVRISLFTEIVGGHKLVFINPTSEVVDHRLIVKWLEANIPSSARFRGRLNLADSMNFSCVFRELENQAPVMNLVRSVAGVFL